MFCIYVCRASFQHYLYKTYFSCHFIRFIRKYVSMQEENTELLLCLAFIWYQSSAPSLVLLARCQLQPNTYSQCLIPSCRQSTKCNSFNSSVLVCCVDMSQVKILVNLYMLYSKIELRVVYILTHKKHNPEFPDTIHTPIKSVSIAHAHLLAKHSYRRRVLHAQTIFVITIQLSSAFTCNVNKCLNFIYRVHACTGQGCQRSLI